MKRQLLSLRISRRAIGAVILGGDGVNGADGRHLRSKTEHAINAAIAFVSRFLDGSITAIAVDRPLPGASAVGDALTQHLATLASERRITLLAIEKASILAAYGVTPVRTRAGVRELVTQYWPQLSNVGRSAATHVVDAAAAGLFAECVLALNPPKT